MPTLKKNNGGYDGLSGRCMKDGWYDACNIAVGASHIFVLCLQDVCVFDWLFEFMFIRFCYYILVCGVLFMVVGGGFTYNFGFMP